MGKTIDLESAGREREVSETEGFIAVVEGIGATIFSCWYADGLRISDCDPRPATTAEGSITLSWLGRGLTAAPGTDGGGPEGGGFGSMVPLAAVAFKQKKCCLLLAVDVVVDSRETHGKR